MSIAQLTPPIELETPKGRGLCWLVIDYGAENDLLWTVAIHDTGEIWTFSNKDIRAVKNITMGRMLENSTCTGTRNCYHCFELSKE